ncbi:MAG: hypothetical protein K2Q22_04755, partial [Cytophagales bacterium]|nr:hypothetical protein [Cytophagales bacterium]
LNSSLGTSYAWSRNGTVVGIARTFVASLTGSYMVSVTNANGCSASSAPVTVSVAGLVPVSVSLASSATAVCSGTGVSFTATGVNAGVSPRYQWIVNNVPRSLGTVFTYSPADGDLVRVALTASGTCLSGSPSASTSVQMKVNPLLAPAIYVTPSVNPTCSNTGVVYTALTTNSGTVPSYKWWVNGALRTATTNTFSYTPSNADVIQASLSTGGTLPACLAATAITSTGLVAKVNATIPTTLVIIPSSTTVCQGASVRFTTSASGTGSSPVYAWYVNSSLQSNTTSSFTFVPSNGQTVRATMVPGGTGLTCVVGGMATAAGVTLNVNSIQNSSASVLASTNTVCSGGMVYFTATGSNLGTTPTYTWL